MAANRSKAQPGRTQPPKAAKEAEAKAADQREQNQAQGSQQAAQRVNQPTEEQERLGDVSARFQPEGTGQFSSMSYEDAPRDVGGAHEFMAQQAQQPARLGPRATTDLTAPAGFQAGIQPNRDGRFEFDPNASPSGSVPDTEGLDEGEIIEKAEAIMTANADMDAPTAYRKAIDQLRARQQFQEGKMFTEVTPPTLGPRGHAGVGAPPPQEALKAARDQVDEQIYKALEYQRNPDQFLKVNTPDQRIPQEPIPTDFRDIQEAEARRQGRASVTV